MTTSNGANYAYFMSITTTASWLALAPKERFEFLEEVIKPLLARHPGVSMRFFDSEAFTTDSTDVILWETAEPLIYQSLVEDLRETSFWGTYFEINRIVPAIENAYALHYDVAPL